MEGPSNSTSLVIDTVVVDLDGPILDVRRRHYRCYAGILAEHGYPAVAPDRYWAMKRRRVEPRRLLAASGAEALHGRFQRAWRERIEGHDLLALDRAQPGARRRLREWHDRRVRLILATLRHHPDRAAEQVGRLGLSGLFWRIVVSADAMGGAGKGRAVLREVPWLDPARCLWVGDTEADAEAAAVVGCRAWLVICGIRSKELLAPLAPGRVAARLAGVDLDAEALTAG
jgi:phosphoglycolate phosphatase-like HAD superfamily hydrolase